MDPPKGSSGRPSSEPIGLQLTRTAKVVSRAFDDALGQVGGSLPLWLILLSLKGQSHRAQRTLAEAVGIEGPTLTHHLNRMEAEGLVTRTRNPENRRVHLVELTEAGEATFSRLLGSVVTFDAQLRDGLSADEVALLGGLLTRLLKNVANGPATSPASLPAPPNHEGTAMTTTKPDLRPPGRQ
jgi:MarR family transcriptional regulator for hemolysin